MPMVDGRTDSVLGPNTLDAYTADPDKRALYRHDTYVREGLTAWTGLAAKARLDDITFIVMKPDAIAGRRCRQIIDVLADEGWLPIAAAEVHYTPLLTREMWRYQFNAASDQRIAVVDHLLGSGPSVLVLLHDTRRSHWLPASVRLTAAKGSADPEFARGGDLRTRIGRVNCLFNFIHTADDPADVIRELQLFSYEIGWAWCRPALATLVPAESQVDSRIRAAEAVIAAHDLDWQHSLQRLAPGDDTWARLAREAGSPEHVDIWLTELGRSPLPDGPARWDVLTVTTSWIDCNATGVEPLLGSVPVSLWRKEFSS